MAQESTSEITALLHDWRNGDRRALDILMPVVYKELQRLAHFQMRQERPGHTMQSSALVNEAYLRLVGVTQTDWESRAHFFAISSQLMRQILVDHARRRQASKRGGGLSRVGIEEEKTLLVSNEKPLDLVALDDALQALARVDERKARVVEMRFFGGLNFDQSAEVLEVSAITVSRDWSTARAWLHREMNRTDSNK